MARVLILSDATCRGLRVPSNVKVVAVDGLTAGGLLSILHVMPGLVQCPNYDIIFVHVGAENLKQGLSVTTLVSLLDLVVFKLHSLSPSARVVISSMLPWPGCDAHTLDVIKNTNKALSDHFGKKAFVRTNFKLMRGSKARTDMFVGKGQLLTSSGCECLWGSLTNFLRYIKA